MFRVLSANSGQGKQSDLRPGSTHSAAGYLDADGHGQNLPPRLLCLQPVRGGAGGDRVPGDWRPGEGRDLPGLLREVSRSVSERVSKLYFTLKAPGGQVCQVSPAHRLQPGQQDDPDHLRGEEISLQLLHLQGQ